MTIVTAMPGQQFSLRSLFELTTILVVGCFVGRLVVGTIGGGVFICIVGFASICAGAVEAERRHGVTWPAMWVGVFGSILEAIGMIVALVGF
jgi:hypothetical protein